MKILSWNINSIRIRINLLKTIIEDNDPDIICLQETKVTNDLFPIQDINLLLPNYKYVEYDGEKSYNGVAILAKNMITDINKINILNSCEKRHISCKINDITLHNFYVPAGGDVPDPDLNNKFDFKLKFLDFIKEYLLNYYNQQDKLIMVGDFNVAPQENDVWSHKQLLQVVSHTQIEIDKFNDILSKGNLCDIFRQNDNFTEKLYSWWSYRARDVMKSNRGRRLDHILVSNNLKNNINYYEILTKYRTYDKPSDHVPVIMDINQ